MPRPIRVGFDDQIFQAQRRGGVSRFFVELIRHLPDQDVEPVLLSDGTRNLHLAESGMVPELPGLNRFQQRLHWASWSLLGRPRTMPRRLPPLDLLHHTFSHRSYLGVWRGPRVMSIYDMTPETYPDLFPLGNPHFAKRRYTEVADRIIPISENTASDMYRFYTPELKDKTVVIPIGVSDQFFHPGPVPPGLPERYLLFVGQRGGYKDFTVALQAFAEIAKTDPTLALVVAGGGPLTTAERTELTGLGVTERVHHVQPTDAQMPALYRDAAVFVFPSRYEGFGLPTIEALAVGTPVVLADASCGREVGGDLALYFPPGDVAQLAAQVRRVLAGEAVERSRTEGPGHARRFDWPTVARRTAEVYRELLAERTRPSA